ncbi:hypothetical protein, partial [Flavonifractor plautii]
VSQLHSTRHLQTMSLCLFAKLILPDPTQRKRLRFGKKEQQNERALTFIKNRSKRYKACSDVEHHNTIDA